MSHHNKMDQYKEKTLHKLDEAKHTMEGVRDTLIGGVKQRVGHMLGRSQLEAYGRDQKLRGKEELTHHKYHLKELSAAEAVEIHLRREALFAEIERTGGFDRRRQHMKHIEVHEHENMNHLFVRSGEPWQQFHLKKVDRRPLLEDIRQRRTRKPLVHVETLEKGLMHSIKLKGKKDFELKYTSDRLGGLWADIKRTDNLNRLRKVSAKDIHDRSAPRLDLFRSVASSQAKRDELIKEIESGAVRMGGLKHVETDDKSRPEMFFAKDDLTMTKSHKSSVNKAQLLNEVREGAAGAIKLKHVETDDKSLPAITDDTSVKTWDKQGFLAEVRQGTELRHI